MNRWFARWKPHAAAVFLPAGWELGEAWYADRLKLDCRAKTGGSQKRFAKFGLRGEFSKLA
ncbi:MAG: hypothetical protein JOZ36_04050 [Acidobacteria bacterium]|nr:hypothetical protein [Acidobacteriota bacterium]